MPRYQVHKFARQRVEVAAEQLVCLVPVALTADLVFADTQQLGQLRAAGAADVCLLPRNYLHISTLIYSAPLVFYSPVPRRQYSSIVPSKL